MWWEYERALPRLFWTPATERRREGESAAGKSKCTPADNPVGPGDYVDGILGYLLNDN